MRPFCLEPGNQARLVAGPYFFAAFFYGLVDVAANCASSSPLQTAAISVSITVGSLSIEGTAITVPQWRSCPSQTFQLSETNGQGIGFVASGAPPSLNLLSLFDEF